MDPFSIVMLVFGVIMAGVEIAATAHQNQENKDLQQNILNQQQDFARESAATSNRVTEEQYFAMYSPAAKYQQLKNAGLSPGLFYGGGGTSGAGSTAAQAQMPATSIPYMNPLVSGGQLGQIMNALKSVTSANKDVAETNNTNKQTEKLDYDIELVKATTNETLTKIKQIEEQTKTEIVSRGLIDTQNQLAQLQLKFDNQTFDDRAKTVTEMLNVIQKNGQKLEKEINILDIEGKNKQEMIDLMKKNLSAQTAELYCRAAYDQAQAMLAKAQAVVAKAQEKLINKQAELTDTQKKALEKEIEVGNAKIKEMTAQTQKIADEINTERWKNTNWWAINAANADNPFSLIVSDFGALMNQGWNTPEYSNIK